MSRAVQTSDASDTPDAPAAVILGFLTDYQDASPWVPTGGAGGWMTTATLRQLIETGRVVVQTFAGHVFHGRLDGFPVCYTHSLFGIVGSGCAEITV